MSENITFQNLLKIQNYYLPKNIGISWLVTKNLKQSYYHLYQQTVLLKIIYIYDFRVEISFMVKWKTF